MIGTVPNSFGARPLREGNDCNLPAGTLGKRGGQFGKKGECGPGASASEPARPTKAPNRVSDNIDEGDYPEWFSGRAGIESAQELVDRLTEDSPESFRASVVDGCEHCEGGDGGDDEYHPDPSEVRDRYDEWASEQMSAQENSQWRGARREFDQHVEGVTDFVHHTLQQAIDLAAQQPNLFQERGSNPALDINELATKVLDRVLDLEEDGNVRLRKDAEGDYVREPGLFQEELVRQLAAGITPDLIDELREGLTDIIENGGAEHIRDLAREASRYFSEDGEDHWRDDDKTDYGDVDDFDTWYEREYGVAPSDWDQSRGGSSNGFTIELSSDKVSSIQREFYTEGSGDLHVHHAYFRVKNADQGTGVGKDLIRSQFRTYDALGVARVSTLANIDAGSYAWARYGFLPRDSNAAKSFSTSVLTRLDRSEHLSPEQKQTVRDLIGNGYDPEWVWRVSDLHMPVQPSPSGFVPKLPNGKVMTVGQHLMSDQNAWEAEFDLSNSDQRARLEQYVGGSVFTRRRR